MSADADPEQLVKYLKDTVGDLAGAFLLTGYGQQDSVSQRSFIILADEDAGGPREWHLEVTAGAGHILPYGRDPLVLAALLKTLFDSQEERVLVFRPPDLLRLLGWGDAVGTRKSLEDAVLRYFDSSYVAKKMARGRRGELLPERLTEGRLITAYGSAGPYVEAGTEPHTLLRVDFNERFVRQLTRASLFGIDWGRVTSFRTQP